VDLVLFSFVGAVIFGLIWFARTAGAPPRSSTTVELDPSPWALPGYALLSLTRGVLAYVLSLVFTLVYGSVAAKNRRAERIMVPLLDVLQGIPVLTFLPVVVLGMISWFPDSNWGLELACIVMIFTGQAWNMTFSYYSSVRAIPTELLEVGRVNRFSSWRRFTWLELPASMIGLVWNSMMSMAGGWFFLMTVEAFSLTWKGKKVDCQLPGIGSYMNLVYPDAWEKGEWGPVIWAIVAMILVIVLTDQVIWRPLIAWSQKFKIEETEAAEQTKSWLLEFVKRSWSLRALARTQARTLEKGAVATALARPAPPPTTTRRDETRADQLKSILGWATGLVVCMGSLYGAYFLVVDLLVPVKFDQWVEVAAGLGFTSFRTLIALALGALWAVPVGVTIGLSPRLARRAQPIVQVLASFPAPMLFPIFTYFVVHKLKIPFAWGCTFLTLFGAQWYILFNVIAGAMTIPHDLREAAQVYHVRGWARWRTLLLPGIFPHLLTGLITAAGGAWNVSIVTEYQKDIGGRDETAFGLGFMMQKALEENDFNKLAAAALGLTLTLVILNRVVWKKLYRYADERFALNR
jgi:NitT/TauT family transport system permease protein